MVDAEADLSSSITVTQTLEAVDASHPLLADPVTSKNVKTIPWKPWIKLGLCCFAWWGVQMVWAMEYSHTTPAITALGASFTVAVLAWCAGPITGLVVQPIIGALSDKFKKRTPFIVMGALLTVGASMVFSVAEYIAGGANTGAVVIALISFWCMDISINCTMVTLRLLVSDLAVSLSKTSGDQQASAQTLASIFQGAGQVTGMLVNGLFSDPLENLWKLYLVAGCSLLLSCAVCVTVATCVASPSYVVKTPQGRSHEKFSTVIKSLFKELISRPFLMLRVLLVQLFTWLGWYCTLTILTSWFADMFFATSMSSSDAADKGDNAGSMAFLCQAVVQLGCSLALTPILQHFTGRLWVIRIGWAATLFMMPVGVLLMYGLCSISILPLWGAQLLWGITGFASAGTNIFPFAIVGQLYANSDNKGFMMGILNVSIVIPQLLDTLYLGTFEEHFGINSCLLLAGCFGLCACSLAFIVRVQSHVKLPEADHNSSPQISLYEKHDNLFEDQEHTEG